MHWIVHPLVFQLTFLLSQSHNLLFLSCSSFFLLLRFFALQVWARPRSLPSAAHSPYPCHPFAGYALSQWPRTSRRFDNPGPLTNHFQGQAHERRRLARATVPPEGASPADSVQQWKHTLHAGLFSSSRWNCYLSRALSRG
ncbi:hypothetical protein P154DRAFT_349014 [Amniculicola lignicola CBS 123094]|uniref:Uncharacterized protein n=1 Tax=Amniculicola lignicola CBS 123094 TaxID=1392246 RepID=A0A6A5W2V5_9PLEO|nr:hypothetical protein P154DRAFT_349014 [Amniculicola lignicola CBS 123094]